MCNYNHELCKCDLRELSKHEINQHYFEFIRNATREEYESNGWDTSNTRGLYKCRICGDVCFYAKNSFKKQLKICMNNCNGVKRATKCTITGFNDIVTTHPEYIKYFVNIEDAYTHTYASHDEVDLICSDCGCIKKMSIYNFIKYGFSCDFCSDGVSYSEKLMTNILDKLSVDYSRQLTYDNGKHKYDFHIKDWKVIFETHGIQHYEENNWSKSGGRTLEEEQANDEYKKNYAINNGIKEEDYHQIDCRYSTLEWCRPNIEKALSSYINIATLTDEDWQEADFKAQKSVKIEVCEYWREQKETGKDLTTNKIADIFKLSFVAVIRYLKWGNENGLCTYNGEEEVKARYKRTSKFIYLIKPDGTKWFEEAMSIKKLAEVTGIGNTTVSRYATSGEPLKHDSRAKYDKKYVGSYIVDINEWDSQHN